MVDFLRALSIVLLLGMFYLAFKNKKFKRFLLIESVLIIVFIIFIIIHIHRFIYQYFTLNCFILSLKEIRNALTFPISTTTYYLNLL